MNGGFIIGWIFLQFANAEIPGWDIETELDELRGSDVDGSALSNDDSVNSGLTEACRIGTGDS